MIHERLRQSEKHSEHYKLTLEHLEDFAKAGLRTLCLAIRVIPEQFYEEWATKYREAENALQDRDDKIEKVAQEIETELTIIGATAIEDKLQEGVPQTISQLLDAHVHVWVLTGDKQETAINIGHSCELLKDEPLLVINADTMDDLREEINKPLQQFRESQTVGE